MDGISGGPEAITLINVFEVPQGKKTEALAAWDRARDYLCRQPGYLSAVLHEAISPDARFHLVNVAKWKSVDDFQTAIGRMEEAGIMPRMEGVNYIPGLYKVIRSDA